MAACVVCAQVDEGVNGALADLERRQMWQEIVADEKAHAHEVVDGAFKVEAPAGCSPVGPFNVFFGLASPCARTRACVCYACNTAL